LFLFHVNIRSVIKNEDDLIENISTIRFPPEIIAITETKLQANKVFHSKLQAPTLHCTVIGFALDWESHKSLKHNCECLTELLERAFFQPNAIHRIQLAEVDWESDEILPQY